MAALLFLLIAALVPVRAQQKPPAPADPFELLTLRLPELFARYGAPRAVYAVRGEYDWQDDVVLEYPQGDFYIYRDQVWQVSLNSALGITCGDPEKAVELVFKNAVRPAKDYLTVPFNDRPWPAELRVNVAKGKISAIYLYKLSY